MLPIIRKGVERMILSCDLRRIQIVVGESRPLESPGNHLYSSLLIETFLSMILIQFISTGSIKAHLIQREKYGVVNNESKNEDPSVLR